MDHADNDILISAYLDGELTDEERAHVEQLLASDAEARQLLEELQALRTSLTALPKHRLEPGFADDVVRLAQEQMQAENSPVALPSLPQENNAANPSGSVWSTWRGFAWAAAALAAALLLFVTNYGKDENGQQVAMQTKSSRTSEKAAEMSAAPASADARQANEPAEASNAETSKVMAPEKESGRDDSYRRFASKSGSWIGDESLQAKPALRSLPSLNDLNADAPEGGRAAMLSTKRLAGQTSDDVLVVRIDLTRDAANRKVFEDILSQSKIAIHVSDLGQEEKRNIEAAAPVADQKALRFEAEPLKIVVAEASADQLHTAINKLKASPDLFRSVAIAEPTRNSQPSTIALPQSGTPPAAASAESRPAARSSFAREQQDAQMMELSGQPVAPPPSSLSSPLAAPAGNLAEPSSGPAPSSPEKKADRADEKPLAGEAKPVKAVFVLRIIDAVPDRDSDK